MTANEIRNFIGFLRNATDQQLQGILDKEQDAGREVEVELTLAEAEARGLELLR